ncbi:MAG: glycerophosphodiester phosphodiesterase [Ignavibacteriales bacterium]|nr:glycerophosphodiester phosphodiesterase [Ignavibacteriales bacterium]
MKIINMVFLILYLFMNFGCDQQNVLVTAHRGASGYAPENTLSSISVAIELGADFAELDAQETADGEIVLLHDKTLKRTTGIEKNIWEVNYSELNSIDAGSWYNEKFKGEPIPKLSEVIDLVNGKMKLNIELKTNGHEKELADRVVKIIEDSKFTGNCILTSFDFAQIDRAKEINPNLKVGYIFKTIPSDIDVFKANVNLLSVHYSLVNKDFMKKSIENNKAVYVWTVNDVVEMKRLIDLGVSSIITNYPDVLKKIIEER